jgi:hypothetical protein
MTVQAALAVSYPQECLVARIARSKQPVEELLGLKPVADKPAPRNTRLWRKPREIEKLPASDRKAVIKLVDGLLARQKLNSQGTRR